MKQFVRITVAAAAAAALGACVVVPARQGPPPPAYRAEYRPAPPPPEHRVEYRAAPPPARVEVRFHEHQREMAREYYRREYHGRGRCPPGLAKRHERCEPPGHERRWRRGERLPREVRVHAVPRGLEARLGPPPRGYRYVQVAGDVLMIAVATGIVVDAIDDLNR